MASPRKSGGTGASVCGSDRLVEDALMRLLSVSRGLESPSLLADARTFQVQVSVTIPEMHVDIVRLTSQVQFKKLELSPNYGWTVRTPITLLDGWVPSLQATRPPSYPATHLTLPAGTPQQ